MGAAAVAVDFSDVAIAAACSADKDFRGSTNANKVVAFDGSDTEVTALVFSSRSFAVALLRDEDPWVDFVVIDCEFSGIAGFSSVVITSAVAVEETTSDFDGNNGFIKLDDVASGAAMAGERVENNGKVRTADLPSSWVEDAEAICPKVSLTRLAEPGIILKSRLTAPSKLSLTPRSCLAE